MLGRKKSEDQNRGRGRGKGNRRGQKPRDKKEDSGPMTLGDISGLLSGMMQNHRVREPGK